MSGPPLWGPSSFQVQSLKSIPTDKHPKLDKYNWELFAKTEFLSYACYAEKPNDKVDMPAHEVIRYVLIKHGR